MNAIGIDLGTTNSVVAAHGPSGVVVLQSAEGETFTPSVLSWCPRTSQFLVGRPAENNAAANPEGTVFSIKRLMGMTVHDLQVDRLRQQFRANRFPELEPTEQHRSVRVRIGDQDLTPVDVSAKILAKLRADAGVALKVGPEGVRQAVITVPAYFEDRQIEDTKRAAELAGLEVLELLAEPAAAAVAYGIDKEISSGRILVFDLGGGTLDVSIVMMSNGKFAAVEKCGDVSAGGDDLDTWLQEQLLAWIRSDGDPQDAVHPVVLAETRRIARQAKHELSDKDEVMIDTKIDIPHGHVVDLRKRITRVEFEKGIQRFVDGTIDCVLQALGHRSYQKDSIHAVLLVGGSTLVPAIRRALEREFRPGIIRGDIDPMHCVARGAAMVAHSRVLRGSGAGRPLVEHLMSVTAQHLGIAVVGRQNRRLFVPIIEKNTAYPLAKPAVRTFVPSADGQRLIRIPIYQGLHPEVEANSQQGIVRWTVPHALPVDAKIDVSFDYDANRILKVALAVNGESYGDHVIEHHRAPVQAPQRPAQLSDLEHLVDLASAMVGNFGRYMPDIARREVVHAVELGREAVSRRKSEGLTQIISGLKNKIRACGPTASLLLSAAVVIETAQGDAEFRADLARAVESMKRAWDDQRGDDLVRTMDTVQLSIARVQQLSRRDAPILDDTTDGWLRAP